MEKTPETPPQTDAPSAENPATPAAPQPEVILNAINPSSDAQDVQTPPEKVETVGGPADAADAVHTADVANTADAPRVKPSSYVTPEMRADPLSRKLMLLSATFASLAVICIGFLTYIYYQKKRAHVVKAPVVENTIAPIISQPLTEIHVKLRNEQDLRAEIVVECTQRETCDFIKNHPAQVRDLLIPILSSIDPSILSSLESKQTMRKSLVDRLNTMEMPGKVLQVHFNNFSIEGKP